MKRKYEYLTNCTETTYNDIFECINDSREITYKTFLRHVSFSHLMKLFPVYDAHPKQGGLMICNDWSVSFYKSKYKGDVCYYMRHSSIEYIFTKQ